MAPFQGCCYNKLVSSLVNTDVNCSFNMFAFSNGVSAIFRFALSIPIPIVSCFEALLNFQKFLDVVTSSASNNVFRYL